MEIQKSIRYRVNVKETAKHEKYWDCTVDIEDIVHFIPTVEQAIDGMMQVLGLSDKLVAQLELRYPIIAEVK